MVSRVSAAQRTSKKTEVPWSGFLNMEVISYFCKGSFNEIVAVEARLQRTKEEF